MGTEIRPTLMPSTDSTKEDAHAETGFPQGFRPHGLRRAATGLPLRPALAADSVTVQLDWVVRGNHAMFFVGKDKGIFAKNDIDLTEIRKGTGSPDAMRLTGNGNAEFGFGDFPTLAVARSQGCRSWRMAAVNQQSPLAMISLAKTVKLSKPADLKGLTIGIHPAGSTYIFFKAFLAANGMTEKDMTIEQRLAAL